MNVCVIGAGYVGLVTSGCLAHFGNQVIAVDVNRSRIEELQAGQVPFFEPGLNDLMKQVARSGSLKFTTDIQAAVKDSEIIFIAVGTPQLADGDADMSQVISVARAIGGALDSLKRRVVVNKSTVPVGSGNWVEMLVNQGVQTVQTVPARSSRVNPANFAVVSNPEFLREGTAIFDSLYPDRIVIGSGDEEAVNVMRQLYRPILNQSFEPPPGVSRPPETKSVPLLVTDLASAEMIKYSANAFLAMKISFANEIAELCEKVGADVRQVTRGIGLDKRIGYNFLNAGIGWGGSCFKKDLGALIQVANEYHCPTDLLEATCQVNERQRQVPIVKLQETLKIIKGRTIGLMGLSFKPDTDDLRDAPSISIAQQLLKMGAQVKAYDPVSMKSCAVLHPELEITYCGDLEELAEDVDALVLVTEWREFLSANWHEIGKRMRQPIVIDGRNALSETAMRADGFTYRGIGH